MLFKNKSDMPDYIYMSFVLQYTPTHRLDTCTCTADALVAKQEAQNETLRSDQVEGLFTIPMAFPLTGTTQYNL